MAVTTWPTPVGGTLACICGALCLQFSGGLGCVRGGTFKAGICETDTGTFWRGAGTLPATWPTRGGLGHFQSRTPLKTGLQKGEQHLSMALGEGGGQAGGTDRKSPCVTFK